MNSDLPTSHSAFVIAGPTAVGKSEVAVELAERTGAEILNADAFQLYAGLDLLTAKPDAPALERVPHHLVGAFPLSESMSVARYLEAARRVVEEIFARRRSVVVVGGTGLYVRALIHGLSPGPASNADLRCEIASLSKEDALRQLESEDPDAYKRVDRANPRRVQRALESARLRALASPAPAMAGVFQADSPPLTGVNLMRERSRLHERIARRTEEMFRRGVLDEVAALDPALVGPTAEQMIGWRECLACIRGEISQREAQTRIEIGTRQYAKRQITWFKREITLEPMSIDDAESPAQTAERIASQYRRAIKSS